MIRDRNGGALWRLGSRLISRLRGPMGNSGGNVAPFERCDGTAQSKNYGDAHYVTDEEGDGAKERAAFSQHISC